MITDSSPLNFPEDATVNEYNFELDVSGERRRRLGLDFETGFYDNQTPYSTVDSVGVAVTTFIWDDVGDDPNVKYQVVQIGSRIYFHDRASSVLSYTPVGTLDIGFAKTRKFSYANIDGKLVIASGVQDLYVVEYDPTTGFSSSTFRLKVRDQWGVEDIHATEGNLREGAGISLRPPSIHDAHTYNLRNQGWGIPRVSKTDGGDGADNDDIIYTAFGAASYGKYPSNADIYHEYLKPDPDDDKSQVRFFETDYRAEPPHNQHAPTGYFIIDVLDRSVSRMQAYGDNMRKYEELILDITTLPDDRTLYGARSVEEYAGRVFYAGFQEEIDDTDYGDDFSPTLSNYVLFSQVVENTASLEKCYQEGDPTSPDASDIVATDGGVIRISGADNIIGLKAIGRSLFVIASNGLWRISGGTDEGFSADNYEVEKVSEHGPTSVESVLEAENTMLYWADNAIYHVVPSDLGTWQANNITFGKIQTLYQAITPTGKAGVKGKYDRYDRKARWVYSIADDSNGNPIMQELIYDVALQAFHQNIFGNRDFLYSPVVAAITEARPFSFTSTSQPVQTSSNVSAGSEEVVLVEETLALTNETPTVKYLVTYLKPNGLFTYLNYSFADLNNDAWQDWSEVDAAGYMKTGQFIGGDSSRDKQVPYLTFHMARGEPCVEGGVALPPGTQFECDFGDCAALSTFLLNENEVGYYWPLDESSGNAVDAKGGQNLTAVGSVSYSNASLIDDCGTETSQGFDGTAYQHFRNTVGYGAKPPILNEFTGGCMFMGTSSNSVVILRISPNVGGSANVVQLGRVSSTSDLELRISKAGATTASHTASNVCPTNVPIWVWMRVRLNWDNINEVASNAYYHVEVYVNGEIALTADAQMDETTAFTIDNGDQRYLMAGSGTGNGRYQHAFYTSHYVSDEVRDGLNEAYKQNDEYYYPDTDTCYTPCQVYECDSLPNYINSVAPWSYWRMDDGGSDDPGVGVEVYQPEVLDTDNGALEVASGSVDISPEAASMPRPQTLPANDNVAWSWCEDHIGHMLGSTDSELHWTGSGATCTDGLTLGYVVYTVPTSTKADVRAKTTNFTGGIGIQASQDDLIINAPGHSSSTLVGVIPEHGFNHVMIVYQTVGDDATNGQVDVYVDGVSVYSKNDGTVPSTALGDITEAEIFNATGNLSRLGEFFVDNRAWTASEISGLKDAYEINLRDYQDPDFATCSQIISTGGEGGTTECTGDASSCLVQTTWDHTNNTASNRWSRQFQVYREVRKQDSDYDVITTRNKVRGRGGSYSMIMETEPLKDCRILGWNLAVTGNQYV